MIEENFYEDETLAVVGTTVGGRFEVTDVLGQGGMGAVYRAVQQPLNREVALKLVYPHDQRARMRFLREARIASTFRHPNVVEIYDYGKHEGNCVFLAMELLRGDSLRHELEASVMLPVERAIQIATCIADVLVGALEVGAVHRDLKPENVVVEKRQNGSERFVVVDFGLAVMTGAEAGELGRLTQEGMIAGTPEYMSPEQIRSQTPSSASDVYSLGIMLYEMLTGHLPFTADEPAMTLSRHLFLQFEPIRSKFPTLEIPGALDELIQRMLFKEPTHRPSVQQVLASLQSLDVGAPERMSARRSGHGRAARMVSMAPRRPAPAATHVVRTRVAWLGRIDDGIKITLAANGINLVGATATHFQQVEAVVASTETSDAQLQELVQSHPCVLARVAETDVNRLADLLRLGVIDVLPESMRDEEIARRIRRAIKRSKRSNRR